MDDIEIIGQVIGVFAVIVLFTAYQMKSRKSLLLVQAFGIALISTQYFMIGATSGAVLNVVCLVRTLFFLFTEGKINNNLFKKYIFPIFFAVMVCVFSIFSWEGWYSSFMLVALAVNSFCTGVCNPQDFRKSLIFTCILAFIYNVIVFSIGGMMNELLSIVSAIIGIVRYEKQLKSNK